MDNHSEASVEKALRVLGLAYAPERNEIRNLRHQLAKEHHPDRGGDGRKLAVFNDALDVLEHLFDAHLETQTHQRNLQPEWQTDPRAKNNKLGDNWKNLNRAMHDIWARAKENGPVEDWTLWAFDGNFFCGVFTVKCNKRTLGFAGEVMKFWNSKGDNRYAVKAIVASFNYNPPFYIVQMNGQDVSRTMRSLESNSYNPANDRNISEKMKSILEQTER